MFFETSFYSYIIILNNKIVKIVNVILNKKGYIIYIFAVNISIYNNYFFIIKFISGIEKNL